MNRTPSLRRATNAGAAATSRVAGILRRWSKKPAARKKKRVARSGSAFSYLATIAVAAVFALWAGWQFEIRRTDHSALLEGPDLVSWHKLARVSVTRLKDRTALRFDEGVLALDGKQVNLRGFITPLASAGNQQHFILSSKPPSCPYCLPAGPDEMVEIFCRQPVMYSYDPITLSGKFRILGDDDSGLYYRMMDAEAASRHG